MVEVNYTYNAFVTNVLDGDTIDCDIDTGFHITVKYRLRLARIDTPELNSSDPMQRQAASNAKAFVVSEVLSRPVMIQTRKADGFGRYLSEIYYTRPNIGDIPWAFCNLSDELLKAGYAKLYVRG